MNANFHFSLYGFVTYQYDQQHREQPRTSIELPIHNSIDQAHKKVQLNHIGTFCRSY